MDTLAFAQHRDFNQQAEAAVRQYCHKMHELTFIEHSADNLIIIANRQFVFRFPRDDAAARRLYFEAALLQRVAGKIPSIAIPKIVAIHKQPLFVVAEYIEGIHLSAEQVRVLGKGEQTAIGQTIAAFIAELQHAVSGSEVRQLRHEAHTELLYGPWEQYFERLFVTDPLPNTKLQPVIDEYYALWKDFVPHENRLLAIHDDLHLRNLLFVGPTLSGILDFGDANTGGVEEELRWVYLMGDEVLNAAIAQYQQLTGMTVDYQHVRVWAVMHELAAFVHGLAAGETDLYPFIRARANLKTWLPGFPV
jgi:aminoglycoside 2''-phosphotransferase